MELVGLPGRDSHYHPFQDFYFLSKQVKFEEGFFFLSKNSALNSQLRVLSVYAKD